jgi:hypothetical protein
LSANLIDVGTFVKLINVGVFASLINVGMFTILFEGTFVKLINVRMFASNMNIGMIASLINVGVFAILITVGMIASLINVGLFAKSVIMYLYLTYVLFKTPCKRQHLFSCHPTSSHCIHHNRVGLNFCISLKYSNTAWVYAFAA